MLKIAAYFEIVAEPEKIYVKINKSKVYVQVFGFR